MKSKIMSLFVCIVFMLAMSTFAAAQVCQGTLSAPTEEVYVSTDFNITFFNAEPLSGGDTVNLSLPAGLTLTGGSNPAVSAPWTIYRWTVQGSVPGPYDFNVSISGPGVNCTRYSNATIISPAIAPIIVPTLTDLGTLTLGQAVSLDVNLTNVGGVANSVSGYVITNSGSAAVPNGFSHASIANSTTATSAHSLTPAYCGVDSVTAYVQNIHDGNGYDVTPVQVSDFFTVVGSDAAFSTVGAAGPVAQYAALDFSFTVGNIGTLDASGVQVDILIDNVTVTTVNVGALVAGATSSQVYNHNVGGITVGTHIVTFRVRADSECSSANNEVSTTFDVTAGTPPPTPPGPSGHGGGGGGGGGGTGDTYILVLTEDHPTQTLKLKTGDTVKYTYDGESYSFMFRYVYSDRAKMGVSRSTSYKEYTLDEDKNYNLNLNDGAESDLGILPSGLNGGSGDFTFELLGVSKKPVITLLPPKKKTISVEDTSAELESAPEEEVAEEEDVFSEGVLEFIETFDERSSAPIWGGIVLSLLIIGAGVALYVFAARKRY
ncbi:MAG: CARDB domain-containing protein [Candidatus Woesearchaeota archaeon]